MSAHLIWAVSIVCVAIVYVWFTYLNNEAERQHDIRKQSMEEHNAAMKDRLKREHELALTSLEQEKRQFVVVNQSLQYELEEMKKAIKEVRETKPLMEKIIHRDQLLSGFKI